MGVIVDLGGTWIVVAFALRICVSIILLTKLGVVGGLLGMCCVQLGTSVDVASRSGTMVSFASRIDCEKKFVQKIELM
jgi:hypothetical protein